MVQVSQDYSSELGQLADMRAFVRDVCQRTWSPEGGDEAIDQLILALSEAATNVMLHAYEGETGRPIHLAVEADAGRVSVALYHRGRDFDPDTVAPPSFDGSRTGGFGLYLMKLLVDEVDYFREPDGWSGVRLVKRRTPALKVENNMQLMVEKNGDVTVVTVNVEQMDASNADDFKSQMAPVLENCSKLVLDLGRVQFVDSRGCGVILSCLKQVTVAGGDLKLCRVTKPARTVFDLIRLHRICEILDSREDAVKAFARPAGAK